MSNKHINSKKLLKEYRELGNSEQHKKNCDYAAAFLDILEDDGDEEAKFLNEEDED